MKLSASPNCGGAYQYRAVCTQPGSAQCLSSHLYTAAELHTLYLALVHAHDTQMNVRGYYDSDNEFVFEYFMFGR